ncbi:hypothetical protein QF035_008974 [Streptomyces umbrinus]|uniref:Uncharacterized protein n=1 Tax=Streptomyces umbrinus TaxID=67370 RepID=A0ABU0T6V0_9ACTN|nr:hypothetical protein [Streptomyces umbrinus]
MYSRMNEASIAASVGRASDSRSKQATYRHLGWTPVTGMRSLVSGSSRSASSANGQSVTITVTAFVVVEVVFRLRVRP